MRIGLLHPGDMGAAVGALLVEAGHGVSWLPAGRGPATTARAQAAGLRAADSLEDTEVVLSICPPHAALDVAREIPQGPGLVIDANAIAPSTAAKVGAIVGEHRFIDGGIVGPPPREPGTTRLFVSGDRASEAAALFAGTALEAIVLDAAPTAASALKMTYAAWSKGTAAMILAIVGAARAEGVEEALRAEWARSQPALERRHESAVASATEKGWRWVAEMQEIAATLSAGGQPAGFHEAAAEIFARYPRPG